MQYLVSMLCCFETNCLKIRDVQMFGSNNSKLKTVLFTKVLPYKLKIDLQMYLYHVLSTNGKT